MWEKALGGRPMGKPKSSNLSKRVGGFKPQQSKGEPPEGEFGKGLGREISSKAGGGPFWEKF